jgi:hypothetical protein
MTAACLPRPGVGAHGGHGGAVPLLLLLLAVGAFLIVLASTHAVIRHGSDAITAQNCFNGGGSVMKQVMEDPVSFRQMRFCNQNGHWFVSIDAHDGGNVTMFPRGFARCIRDVIDYAKRSGFTRMVQVH